MTVTVIRIDTILPVCLVVSFSGGWGRAGVIWTHDLAFFKSSLLQVLQPSNKIDLHYHIHLNVSAGIPCLLRLSDTLKTWTE